MYTLAVCAEMVFLDLPAQERARRLERFRTAFTTPVTVSTATTGGSS